MKQLLTPVIFYFPSWVLGSTSSSARCYHLNSGVAETYTTGTKTFTYVPCPATSDAPARCCVDFGSSDVGSDICRSNGLCYTNYWNGWSYRGACTDQNWESPNCPKYCTDTQDNLAWAYHCAENSYCCGGSSECCNKRFTATTITYPAATTTKSTTTSPAVTPGSPSHSSKGPLSSPSKRVPIIVSSIIGGLLVLSVIVLGLSYCCSKRFHDKAKDWMKEKSWVKRDVADLALEERQHLTKST